MPHILIIEDDQAIAELLTDILAEDGYTVHHAANGRDALTMLEQERPALILCDLMLPLVSGWEVCRWLHANPTYRSIPLVLMSARATVQQADCAYTAFLRKPFDVVMLLELVHTCIGPAPREQ